VAKSEELTREQRGPSVLIAGIEITPIERIRVDVFVLEGNVVGRVEKRPLALLLRDGEREWRIDLSDDQDAS
jgi:hypothetical protein